MIEIYIINNIVPPFMNSLFCANEHTIPKLWFATGFYMITASVIKELRLYQTAQKEK